MPHRDQKPERAAILYSGSMSHADVSKHLSDASADYIALCTFDFEVINVNASLQQKLRSELSQNGTKLYHELIGIDQPPSIQSNSIDIDNQRLAAMSFDSANLGRILVKAYATRSGGTENPGLLLIAHPMEYSSTPNTSENAFPGFSPGQLINALADAAFLCNAKGDILFCSDPAPAFFGLAGKSRIEGANFQSFLSYDSIGQGFITFSAVAGKESARLSSRLTVLAAGKRQFETETVFSCIQTDTAQDNYVLITFRPAIADEAVKGSIVKKEARLTRIFNLVHEGQSPKAARLLLSQFGEMLGAVACAYTKVENDHLVIQMKWESPFNENVPASLGNKQLYDHLSASANEISLIRKPQLYTFLESEEFNADEADVKALVGVPVSDGKKLTGILSAVLSHNISLDEGDKQVIMLLAGAFSKLSMHTGPAAETDQPDFSIRELLDCFIDPVYVLDQSGVFIDVNRGAVDLYGYSREELIGQTPEFLSATGENDFDLLRQYIVRAAKGEIQRFEWYGKRKNGEVFPKEVVMNKGTYYGKEVLFAIGRDLTESKKAEELLIQSNKELRETNLSKDKFFSILAHDLKNPFQGLLGFIDLLYDDLDELTNEQVKEYLSNVRSASYHTYSLLENLLDWSRIQTGKMPFNPTQFDISDEVETVISVLNVNAERKDIRLINEIPAQTLVQADRNMIHSVIQNLVTNSIKFSNVKGKVVVRARLPKVAAKPETSTDSKAEQWLEVSVADNGIGIPEELLPKLFSLNGQYSQSGTSNEPGTGLGLVLCREMVEKNGGRIWAESISGQGATFIFTVPMFI